MSVAIVSACYGGYDHVAPIREQTIDTEWVMVTDNQDLVAPGWKVIYEPRPHMHPRLAAKVPKCHPFAYTDATTTVWLDASCRLIRDDALYRIIKHANDAEMAQIVHPWRDDIVDEAEASVGMPKYEGQRVRDQVSHYIARGFPRNSGLYATGLIVRNNMGSIHEEFGHRWLTEQCRWTYQDQLSQMPVLASMEKRGYPLKIRPLGFPLHGSGVFEWHFHKDGT